MLVGKLTGRVIKGSFHRKELSVYSLLAMAQAATCYNLVRPKISEDNIIKIKGGR